MGSEMSAEERERREEERKKEEQKRVERFVTYIKEGPNLRVNDRIKRFTGLDSSENLRKHYEKRKMEAGDCAPDWTKNLAEKLGALTSAPELAGLGALAIAVLIDIISFSPPEENTKDALRSVFAEEKASEVWDQIDECLKRYRMNINNKDDLRRIECQLSAALTKLKNSMLRDGHMSSEALKVWVNGAAFHIQMLIHLVRLGGIQTSDPIKELISIYKNDLDQLFVKHRGMIEGKCKHSREYAGQGCSEYYLVDEESKRHFVSIWPYNYKAYFEGYYDKRYGRQKPDIHQYFSDVGQNLQELIDQRGSFNIS